MALDGHLERMSGDDIDDDLIEFTFTESKQALSKSLKTSEKLGERSFDVIRYNLIILSVWVVAFRFVQTSDGLIILLMSSVVFGIIISTIISMYSYITIKPQDALNAEGLSMIQDADDVSQVQKELSTVYAMWVDDNTQQQVKNRKYLLISMGCTLTSVFVFAVVLSGSALL